MNDAAEIAIREIIEYGRDMDDVLAEIADQYGMNNAIAAVQVARQERDEDFANDPYFHPEKA